MPNHPEHLKLGDEEEREAESLAEGGRGWIRHVKHPEGSWAASPPMWPLGKSGLVERACRPYLGAFSLPPHPAGWVSLDPSLLESKPRAVIFWSSLTPNTGQGWGSCENWETRRDPPETGLRKQRHPGLIWTSVSMSCRVTKAEKWGTSFPTYLSYSLLHPNIHLIQHKRLTEHLYYVIPMWDREMLKI